MTMTIEQLDSKYVFCRKKIAEDSGINSGTVSNFLNGKHRNVNVKTASAIINALPISQIERAALIESLFSPAS